LREHRPLSRLSNSSLDCGFQGGAVDSTVGFEEIAMSEGHTTTDHEVIKKWAEERGGRPATVKKTEEDGHAGILRIDFGPKDEGLEEIGWDEFFEKFEEARLAFLYQDKTKDGKVSRFYKFVSQDHA
jgi:hypothetical protein